MCAELIRASPAWAYTTDTGLVRRPLRVYATGDAAADAVVTDTGVPPLDADAAAAQLTIEREHPRLRVRLVRHRPDTGDGPGAFDALVSDPAESVRWAPLTPAEITALTGEDQQ